MKELRMKRLQHEVKERVVMCDGDIRNAFQEVLNHLYKEHELYYDNDYHVQAMNVWKDILTLKEMIVKYNTQQK